MDAPIPLSVGPDGSGGGVPAVQFYRAVATDFDGTLTTGGAPEGRVLAALTAARAAGIRLVLVTGRIYAELLSVWPEVSDYVDIVVAENGAVLVTPSQTTLLGGPIDVRLSDLLVERGVAFRRGEVLLAGKTSEESEVIGAIRELELDCQTVANRGELMILPAGVSKASGVRAALEQLGLSYHNAIGIGDAENDLALLEGCELGVAVANAVGSLKRAADVVLDAPAEEGVIRLLEGDLLSGRRVLPSRRHHLTLGVSESGESVDLPTSQFNLLVAGGTGSGKSFLTGLVAEQLIQQGYSVLVSDPEGDHADLSRLHGAMVEGGELHVPQPDELLRFLHNGYASMVLDLSGLDPAQANDYLADLLPRVEAHRRATGLPHWIFLDEAHGAVGRLGRPLAAFDASQKGYCLSTWRPDDLAVEVVASIDAVVALGSIHPDPATVELAASVAGLPAATLAGYLQSDRRRAVLVRRDRPRWAVAFTPGARFTHHIRHEHKYGLRPLEAGRQFHFRRSPSDATGARASNLVDLEEELSRCDRAVIIHHCTRRDFSRWVRDVFHDADLARDLTEVERTVHLHSPEAIVEWARVGLIGAVQSRIIGRPWSRTRP